MNLKNMQLSVYYSTWQMDSYIAEYNFPIPLSLNTSACPIDRCVFIIDVSVNSVMRSVFE